MASKRHLQHPDHPLIKLRPLVDDKDLPDIKDFMIPEDFGK